MGYVNRTVQMETDELTILQNLVRNIVTDCAEIVCLDNEGNIVSDTDSYLAEQFESVSNQPSVILQLLNNCRLKWIRSNDLSSTGSYKVSFIGANGTEYSLGDVYFSHYAAFFNIVETKRFKYRIVFNSQFIHFTFYDFSLRMTFAVCTLSDGTISASSYSTDSSIDPTAAAFVFDDNTTGMLYHRFQYQSSEPDKIEILKNKVFRIASNIFSEPLKAKTTAIYDCNYYIANQRMKVDGKEYMTLGNFILVLIGEESSDGA